MYTASTAPDDCSQMPYPLALPQTPTESTSVMSGLVPRAENGTDAMARTRIENGGPSLSATGPAHFHPVGAGEQAHDSAIALSLSARVVWFATKRWIGCLQSRGSTAGAGAAVVIPGGGEYTAHVALPAYASRATRAEYATPGTIWTSATSAWLLARFTNVPAVHDARDAGAPHAAATAATALPFS